MWITCKRAELVPAKGTTVPSAKAANNPNAAPFWLVEGDKKPDAKTTAEPPPNPLKSAVKEATIGEPAAGVTSKI